MQEFIPKQLLIPEHRRSNGHIVLKTKRPLPPDPSTPRDRPVKHVRIAEYNDEESNDEDGDIGNERQTKPLRVSSQLSRDKKLSQLPNHGRRSITSFLKDRKDVKTTSQQETTPPTASQPAGPTLKERPDVIDLVNTCSPPRPASDRAQPKHIPTAPCYQPPSPQNPLQISKTPTENGVAPATPVLRDRISAHREAYQTPVETPNKHDLSLLLHRFPPITPVSLAPPSTNALTTPTSPTTGSTTVPEQPKKTEPTYTTAEGMSSAQYLASAATYLLHCANTMDRQSGANTEQIETSRFPIEKLESQRDALTKDMEGLRKETGELRKILDAQNRDLARMSCVERERSSLFARLAEQHREVKSLE
ncbi:hypothetical protein BDV19DRAFT_392057 [Aspergillus venezuelensis]